MKSSSVLTVGVPSVEKSFLSTLQASASNPSSKKLISPSHTIKESFSEWKNEK
jgi:hypothetical protein